MYSPYDSGGSTCLPGGTNAGSTLKRLGKRHVVGGALDAVGAGVKDAVAVGVLDGEQIDLRREGDAGREVPADADRGDEARPAHGRVRVGDVRIRLRPRAAVIVDWLMNWMVREVSGAWLLAKNAAVRALATAPSMAKTSVSQVAE